jgi:hypothetical protein
MCPKCKRQFARTKQSHLCAPALSPEDYVNLATPGDVDGLVKGWMTESYESTP